MLNDYFAVLDGGRQARYLDAKQCRTGVERLDDLSDEALWDLHGRSPTRSDGRVSLLDLKIELARRVLSSCHFCERRCGVDRLAGEKGVCGVGAVSNYASEFLHFGEEPELVPSHTIFFSGCTFKCVYCQNWDIASSADVGLPVDPQAMAGTIEARHVEGARNVNFVGGNPDPHLWTILEILCLLDVSTPIVWNSNMYLSTESMALLEGVVDVYLGDFRYGNDACARKYSSVDSYFKVVSRNFATAYSQADVMLRHLVLPGHLKCCTKPIMAWVSENMPGVYFNLMFQYYPCYRAGLFPEIDRRLTIEERNQAVGLADRYGLRYT